MTTKLEQSQSLISHVLRSIEDDFYAGGFAIKKIYLFLLLGAALLAGLGGTGYFGYQWYQSRINQRAQLSLAAIIEAYGKATEKNSGFEEVIALAESEYKTHAHAKLSPFFMAYKADALTKLARPDEALQTMHFLVEHISKESPFYYLYQTKRALMMLDHSDATIQKDGHALLQQLAYEELNISRDMALYYLGDYAFIHDDLAQARIAWQTLMGQVIGNSGASIWVQKAAQKLSLLV